MVHTKRKIRTQRIIRNDTELYTQHVLLSNGQIDFKSMGLSEFLKGTQKKSPQECENYDHIWAFPGQ